MTWWVMEYCLESTRQPFALRSWSPVLSRCDYRYVLCVSKFKSDMYICTYVCMDVESQNVVKL
jgi:hypothetical protein